MRSFRLLARDTSLAARTQMRTCNNLTTDASMATETLFLHYELITFAEKKKGGGQRIAACSRPENWSGAGGAGSPISKGLKKGNDLRQTQTDFFPFWIAKAVEAEESSLSKDAIESLLNTNSSPSQFPLFLLQRKFGRKDEIQSAHTKSVFEAEILQP